MIALDLNDIANNNFSCEQLLAVIEEIQAANYSISVLHSYQIPNKTHFIFLDTVANLFGVNHCDDRTRIFLTIQTVLPLLKKYENRYILGEIHTNMKSHHLFKQQTSQTTRYAPLVIAIKNLIEGKAILDFLVINELSDTYYEKLLKNYIENDYFYKTIADKGWELPAKSLKLTMPEKKQYRLLDIGHAPRNAELSCPETLGSGGLNLLSTCLQKQISCTGIDIEFPKYTIERGRIKRSVFVNTLGEYHAETEINGIRHLNGNLSKYNIFSPNFVPNEKFDFIVLCMVLHHFFDYGEEYVIPFSSYRIVDDIGKELSTEEKAINANKKQIDAIDRLLSKLSVGGIFFINFYMSRFEKHNADLFFIIQRQDEKTFQLFRKAPIPFQPNIATHPSWRHFNLLKGSANQIFPTKGLLTIDKYAHLPDQSIARLEELFTEADALVYSHMAWNECFWQAIYRAQCEIDRHSSLIKIFSAFLQNVPPIDTKEIMTKVSSLELEI